MSLPSPPPGRGSGKFWRSHTMLSRFRKNFCLSCNLSEIFILHPRRTAPEGIFCNFSLRCNNNTWFFPDKSFTIGLEAGSVECINLSVSLTLDKAGLRHPASAAHCARLAGRCPNNDSLFPPLAAVVVVAPTEGRWHAAGVTERFSSTTQQN